MAPNQDLQSRPGRPDPLAQLLEEHRAAAQRERERAARQREATASQGQVARKDEERRTKEQFERALAEERRHVLAAGRSEAPREPAGVPPQARPAARDEAELLPQRRSGWPRVAAVGALGLAAAGLLLTAGLGLVPSRAGGRDAMARDGATLLAAVEHDAGMLRAQQAAAARVAANAVTLDRLERELATRRRTIAELQRALPAARREAAEAALAAEKAQEDLRVLRDRLARRREARARRRAECAGSPSSRHDVLCYVPGRLTDGALR